MNFDASAIKAVGRGLLSLIPVAGPAIESILSDLAEYHANIKFERFVDFVKNLGNEVVEVQDQLNNEYINKDDFLDVFEATSRYVCSERTEEKRIFFRNILVNSMIAENCDYDRTEFYLRLLERMNSLELLILKILMDPVTYANLNPLLLQNYFKSDATEYMVFRSSYKSIEVLTSLTENEREDVEESVYFLENNRLICEVLEAEYEFRKEPVEVLEDKLTSKGRCFLEFLLK